MIEYSQGICGDGAAILENGQPLTPEQIVQKLNEHEKIMNEIHRLRNLEDSYDTEEMVLSEILLSLNKLCGN